MLLKLIAKLLARPAVATWLIRRAMRTPYTHLDGYMMRYWLFNPYHKAEDGERTTPRYRWFPWSIRIHHILREDHGRDFHDHPWNARTFILRGFYTEARGTGDPHTDSYHFRKPGDTARIDFEQYHKIMTVSHGGVWTLFISGPYRGDWGFLVDGDKVPHAMYDNDSDQLHKEAS